MGAFLVGNPHAPGTAWRRFTTKQGSTHLGMVNFPGSQRVASRCLRLRRPSKDGGGGASLWPSREKKNTVEYHLILTLDAGGLGIISLWKWQGEFQLEKIPRM
jgi:hypothetical protein